MAQEQHNASTLGAAAIGADERCQYPNKLCVQRRTTKRDGGLHRFCAAHRDKANRNQKRWLESRQRKTKRLSVLPSGQPASVDQLSQPPHDPDLERLELEFEELFGVDLSSLDNTDSMFDGAQDLSMLDDDALLDFIDQFLGDAETGTALPA